MSVFMLVEIGVKDSGLYAEYIRRIPDVIRRHNGRYIVGSSKVTPNSGGWKPDRIILVEFDNIDNLRECFASPEYAALAPLRERSTATRSIVIESENTDG